MNSILDIWNPIEVDNNKIVYWQTFEYSYSGKVISNKVIDLIY